MTRPIIETERLILRPVEPSVDFDPWAESLADPQIVRYLGTAPLNRAQSWRNMAMVMGHWAIRGFGFFSVVDRKSGEWVGRVGPWQPHGWPGTEVGWTIARDHWRKGYALEAGAAAIDYAFAKLGWERVIHVILEGNTGSIAVAEKLGSRCLGEQQGLPGVTDERVLIYGQSR